MTGQRVLVVGSAPDLVWPTRFDGKTFCVNGAAGLAHRRACPIHYWSVTRALCQGNTAYRKRTLAFIRGVSTQTLMIVSPKTEDRSAISHQLRQLDCHAGVVRQVTLAERADITAEVLGAALGVGAPDARISSGVFAVCYALWSGASEVVLAGLSLTRGHAYTKTLEPRVHGPADARAFGLLQQRYTDRIRTTSMALQETYGMAGC